MKRSTPEGSRFPRRFAATQRFTLGEPRTVQIAGSGRHVLFARSTAGDDPTNRLWSLDLTTGVETLIVDPAHLDAAGSEELPALERARRERAREAAGGVVGFATDSTGDLVALALGGSLVVANVPAASARILSTPGPVFDPRPDPTGTRIAYVSGSGVHLSGLDGSHQVLVDAPEDASTLSWGAAEFIAAEEMRRHRGLWWSPDGRRLALCRVDTAEVPVWWIADPARPEREPVAHRYPAAGRANARVTLHVLDVDDPGPQDGSATVQVDLDHETWPYLASVSWIDAQTLLITVQSRDQRRLAVMEADASTGAVTTRWEDHDEDWVELVTGVPACFEDGCLVTVADREGARRLLVDGAPVSPPDIQVRSVAAVGPSWCVFHANPLTEPSRQGIWRYDVETGTSVIIDDPGVHQATVATTPTGVITVVRSATPTTHGATTTVLDGPEIRSLAEIPDLTPRFRILNRRREDPAVAVLTPSWHDGGPLPVLMDPYGGPHAQRVVSARSAHLGSQWFAENGFAVVVVDGRGTPGRGSAWERAVKGDLAAPVLEDQIRGLELAARDHPFLDLSRVGIRGWSFGGFLAALAVMARPDVFHAGVAGAPVTQWRWYDTHYTERYLGHPDEDPAAYARSSLERLAGSLERPLLLIHGLADDNVVAAHTLALSSWLLAAGRSHEVLPLSGVTHMTPQEVVAENLLVHQWRFLARHLGVSGARLGPSAPRTTVPIVRDRLAEIFQRLPVAATADREHEAAVELLLLVILVDGRISGDELDEIRAITVDQGFESETFSFDQHLGEAVGKVRSALGTSEGIEELLDDISDRITSQVLRSSLFAAARDVALADHDLAEDEHELLGQIAARFG